MIAKCLQHSLIIAQNSKYCRQIWIPLTKSFHSVSIGHKQARPAPSGGSIRISEHKYCPHWALASLAYGPVDLLLWAIIRLCCKHFAIRMPNKWELLAKERGLPSRSYKWQRRNESIYRSNIKRIKKSIPQPLEVFSTSKIWPTTESCLNMFGDWKRKTEGLRSRGQS